MKAKVTRSFSAVPSEDKIHPNYYYPDDIVEGYPAEVAVRNGWGERIDEVPEETAPESPTPPPAPSDEAGMHAAVAAASAAGAAFAPGIPIITLPEPDPMRARVSKAWAGEFEGEELKLAKGAIVEGALAAMLIESGHAVSLKAKGAAPEQK
jgi:hypothetical protein